MTVRNEQKRPRGASEGSKGYRGSRKKRNAREGSFCGQRATYGSREEWLRARRIGSSDAPAVLGLSPHHGPWDVLERLRGEAIDQPMTPEQQRGQQLEAVVLQRYVTERGVAVRRPLPYTMWSREEWATATPDALREDGWIVEAKTDRIRDRWGEPTTIERWTPDAAQIVRPDYYVQVAHQMWVLDAPGAELAVLVPGDDPFIPDLLVYRIVRDREFEASLVERLRSWWEAHVVRGEPLPVDGSDAAGRHLARRERSGARPATLQEITMAAQYAALGETIRQAEEARRVIGQQLMAAAGEVSRLDLPVGRVSVVRAEGRRKLDERALLAEHPELADVIEQYRRPGAPYVYLRISGVPRPGVTEGHGMSQNVSSSAPSADASIPGGQERLHMIDPDAALEGLAATIRDEEFQRELVVAEAAACGPACPACMGDGYYFEAACYYCGGSGEVPRWRSVAMNDDLGAP